LRRYARQVRARPWHAAVSLALPGIGNIFVHYVPALAIAHLLAILARDRRARSSRAARCGRRPLRRALAPPVGRILARIGKMTGALYLTQIMYIHAGREQTFEAFESVVLPLLTKYRGELVLRLRGDKIAGSAEAPHEVHIVKFENDDDLGRYASDPERQRVLPLRDEAVRSSLLIRGALV
jgi:hypothetical protein